MRTLFLALAVLLIACPSADDDDTTEPITPEPPCTLWGAAETDSNVQDEALTEISGIVASRANPGVLWVHQDSASGALLTAISTTGYTLATMLLDGAPSDDWEDLAIGACGGDSPSPSDGGPWCLVVGDIGDNAAARSWVTMLRVEEPTVDPDALEAVSLLGEYEAVRATYPEGAQDAEALVLEPDGTPVVFTKRNDGDTRLYRMPTVETDPPTEATLIAETEVGDTGGLVDAVTAADLTADGSRLLLRTYTAGYLYVLDDDGLDAIDEDQQISLSVSPEPQGEAIGWSDDERDILHVSEGEQPPLYRLSCLD